jgi:hypothetical protein
MYAVTERPAARAWRDNRSTSRAMPSAFVAGSCRQNSTSLAMIPTHATNTRPTQIHTKQANQSNAYGRASGVTSCCLTGGGFSGFIFREPSTAAIHIALLPRSFRSTFVVPAVAETAQVSRAHAGENECIRTTIFTPSSAVCLLRRVCNASCAPRSSRCCSE